MGSPLTRFTGKIFGSLAGSDQRAKFGSLAANAPAFTTDPSVVQSLSNYLSGWFAAVIGGNSPCIEDMNALQFLFSYQINYLLQAGIPEWDSGTIYYLNQVCMYKGKFYVSMQDDEINHIPDGVTGHWYPYGGNMASSGAGDIQGEFDIIELDATSGSFIVNFNGSGLSLTLEKWPAGQKRTIKCIHTNANTVSITASNGATLDGFTAYPTPLGPLDSMTVYRSDATKFYVI